MSITLCNTTYMKNTNNLQITVKKVKLLSFINIIALRKDVEAITQIYKTFNENVQKWITYRYNENVHGDFLKRRSYLCSQTPLTPIVYILYTKRLYYVRQETHKKCSLKTCFLFKKT